MNINKTPSLEALQAASPETSIIELRQYQSSLMQDQRVQTAEALGVDLEKLHSMGSVAIADKFSIQQTSNN